MINKIKVHKFDDNFLSFPFLWVTVNAEAGMPAHCQCWGPATKAWPIVHAPMYALVTVYVWMVCYSALQTGQVCGV